MAGSAILWLDSFGRFSHFLAFLDFRKVAMTGFVKDVLALAAILGFCFILVAYAGAL